MADVVYRHPARGSSTRTPMNQKRIFRARFSVVVSREHRHRQHTPLLSRSKSVDNLANDSADGGLYLDVPEEWDDPYAFPLVTQARAASARVRRSRQSMEVSTTSVPDIANLITGILWCLKQPSACPSTRRRIA